MYWATIKRFRPQGPSR